MFSTDSLTSHSKKFRTSGSKKFRMAQKFTLIREIDQTIPEFYSGQNIFVTGFTGFIGKLFVEKLLRCCPDVGNIYVLIRQKRGIGAQQRLDEILENELFDTLKSIDKNALKKLIPVEGNIAELDLGLSRKDREEIINKVSIIYSVAASVRFDLDLRDAIMENTRSVREMCRLALDVKNITVFVHVSTAYAHSSGVTEVYERLYDPRADWKQAIEIAEEMDPKQLNAIAPKYMEGYPNTYIFTKSLGENVVHELCQGKIPTVIARPTIVTGLQMDPIEGWSDNLNGPPALLVAMKKGVLRTFFGGNVNTDLIPADELVRGIIKTTLIHSCTDQNEINVVNISSNNVLDLTIPLVQQTAKHVIDDIVANQVWHHSTFCTNSLFVFCLRTYLFQLIPALFIDAILAVMQKKPMAVKIQRRLFYANDLVQYFNDHNWTIYNDKYLELDDHLLPNDKNAFRMLIKEIDFSRYFRITATMCSKYVLKEDLSDFQKLKSRQVRLYWAHYFLKYTTYTATLIASYNWIVVPFLNSAVDYLESL